MGRSDVMLAALSERVSKEQCALVATGPSLAPFASELSACPPSALCPSFLSEQVYPALILSEGLYSPRLLACDMCGKAGSFETPKKCSRCKVRSRIMPQRPLSPRPDRFYPSQSVAYCGVACQHAGWKNGHKHECKQLAAAAGV